MANKKLYKRKGFLAWAITTGALAVILTSATIVANVHTGLSSLLNFALGSGSNIYAPGSESAYSATYSTRTEAANNGKEVNLTVCEEGMTLLKNDNNFLPLKTPVSDTSVTVKPKVSIFGKNSVNVAIGGSGSGAASGTGVTLLDSLEAAGYEVNETLVNFYNDSSASGSGRAQNSSDLDSGDTVVLSTGETPVSSYTSTVKDSFSSYSDAAIVVFTRIGGEGFDLPRTMVGSEGYRNEDDHFLQLDKNETEMLQMVCENFDHVVVVINSGSPMELGFLENPDYYAYQEKIDAAIWMGYPGNSGATALGRILNGQVNPSGRTADTFSMDFKEDPTWNNFGDNRITQTDSQAGGDQYVVDGTKQLYYFVDYEEGEYVGYRYYETRGSEDPNGGEGEDWYDANVVYPFGYGLSYTTFSWEVKNKSNLSTLDTNNFTIEVQVTNTGDVAGKDVVEIYGHAPYTAGEIEKPYEVLVGFSKTNLLQPGESQTLSIEINPYYLASYDYKDLNNNGFAGYELEAGAYQFFVNKNAHDKVDTIDMTVTSDILYEKDPVTGAVVENLYTDCEDSAYDSDTGLETILSRNDWDGTWPNEPTDAERSVTADFINQFKDTSTNNPTDYDSMEYPMMDATKSMTLRDMLYQNSEFVGSVDYDDTRWDTLLDQMNFDEALTMYNQAAYQIMNVDSVSLPFINCADGPVGWTSFINKSAYEGTCSYACGVIIAMTWNTELVEQLGIAVGEEGLVGDSGGTPFTGWYAPAMNIHRSPFGGRNFEYFSEDAFLSGKMAAAEVKGCQSKGTVPFIKHFALNEQETHRSVTGDASWVNEQAMREIFLRPFEIAVKEGGSMGLMTSFNRIGTRWTGGDYRLVTTILRGEWGFKGAVICDFNTTTYMNPRQMIYAGGDLNLYTTSPDVARWSDADSSSTGDVVVLRNALKNVCYAMVNSNAMKGEVIGRTMAPWQILFIAVDCGVLGACVLWGALYITLSILRDKKRGDVEQTAQEKE